MPEGDTIFRAARTLQRALAGDTIVRFESGLAEVAAIERHTTIVGRSFEAIEARGKHLLMRVSGPLILRTHMRMQGSWHLYRPGEVWQRPKHQMRILFETERFCAVAFLVHEAEWLDETSLQQSSVARLGPDVLHETFDSALAAERMQAAVGRPICDVLLDQRVLAGVGNVYKSELLFLARLHPLQAADTLDPSQLQRLARDAALMLRANVKPDAGGRRTTGQLDANARLWVYDRAGKPCRVCGNAIVSEQLGAYARRTYYCPHCQTPKLA